MRGVAGGGEPHARARARAHTQGAAGARAHTHKGPRAEESHTKGNEQMICSCKGRHPAQKKIEKQKKIIGERWE